MHHQQVLAVGASLLDGSSIGGGCPGSEGYARLVAPVVASGCRQLRFVPQPCQKLRSTAVPRRRVATRFLGQRSRSSAAKSLKTSFQLASRR